MKEIPIVNQDFLNILKQWEWFYENRDHVDSVIHRIGTGKGRKPERTGYSYWTGEEYLKVIQNRGRSHEGYPDDLSAYNIRIDQAKWKGDIIDQDVYDKYTNYNEQMMIELSTRHNALCTLYPPGGYISWHNNANASAYNLIFTWSETGDGCFQYVDGKTNEMVVLQDKPGWQCRYGYFGSYHDSPEKLVYHSARTDCWRMTISYIFEAYDNAISHDFQLEIIEEILTG